MLAFALVANLWWQHHKLMALFQFVEPGMVGIVLALLGGVALVPYPTSLVGNTDAVAPDGRPVGAGADDHPGTSPRAAAGRHRLINRYLPDE